MFRRKTRPDTKRDLAEATKSLAEAKRTREEQEAKRQRENADVMSKFEEIAKGNHLAELAYRAFAERYGREPH